MLPTIGEVDIGFTIYEYDINTVLNKRGSPSDAYCNKGLGKSRASCITGVVGARKSESSIKLGGTNKLKYELTAAGQDDSDVAL